ncbi:uncharacterized protein LOC128682634 [Plodia interpunctella]|uniref:uncharacterized protein LOC128682634 n=1 Tax=Plodia interpunctella TaxID=58824 RepID=UPI0023675E2C|nr:uncharacterized protein LOC128682634 [Plodia interpunctella]XP_053623480.1 uncharacterized protein LOC128682634 [Plodia interpunctella]
MALYLKQDFSPPILSRRWIAIKFRPNMLVHNRRHIEAILESGLLFREDSVSVEQETPTGGEVWRAAGGARGGALTRGEGALAAVAVGVALVMFPPRGFHRSSLLNILCYTSIPLLVRSVHRTLSRGALASLLAIMRDYLALARRAAACVKEYAALHTQLGSITSSIESCRTLLVRQQSSLCLLLSRASSATLGNAPWMRADVAWDHVTSGEGDLTKIHHAFLVVQSTFLKHIAMAHYIPPSYAQRIYKNYNERIYWLHNAIIPHVTTEFVENYEALDRKYRLLKNFGANDSDNLKKLGAAAKDIWLYSDVHGGIAKSCLELKLNLNKCNTLDVFLDSCALQNQELDLEILNKDLDEIVDGVTRCLTALQNSQIRLMKLKSKIKAPVEPETRYVESDVSEKDILKIEDKEPVVTDEVFFFVKTEDDDKIVQTAEDSVTGPGKKERRNTEIVLSELKRKLGKREDAMRERERQALVKTMPELKDVPEFPRQIKYEEFYESKGFIGKFKKKSRKLKLFKSYKIQHSRTNNKKYDFNIKKYEKENDIHEIYYEANEKLNVKSRLITLSCDNKRRVVTKWCKFSYVKMAEKINNVDNLYNSNEESDFSGDVSANVKSNVESKFKFSKRDLELSPSTSESDFEISKEKQLALLKDARRHRAVRRKNHPVNRAVIDKDVDESLKPIEYSFGTGMAMASMLQVNSNARMPLMVQEEVFIGDGEVSNDSGNDEDA